MMTIRTIWQKLVYKKIRHWQRKIFTSLKECGLNNYICEGFQIGFPENVSLGSHIFIGRNVRLDGSGQLTIGSGCIIARDVEILTRHHNKFSQDLRAIPYDERFDYRPVCIEDNVTVGMRTVILPGVTIGEGSVIGACSVVTKDIPPLAVAAGNPARVIRYRDREQYFRLKEAGKIYLKENYNYDVSPDRLK